jgi:3-oxoacyl-[acyl-carrier protein] reductase
VTTAEDERRPKVVAITGASSGIGEATALRLAAEGAGVVLGARREQPLKDLQARIAEAGGQAAFIPTDVRSRQDMDRLVALACERFGRLDVLVNNAGIAPRIRADVLEASEASFDELIATNLRGPYFLTQSVAAWMIRQHAANPAALRSIINISSVSATVASINRGDYCIAKAGIAMATKLWAVRLAEYGIGVYEVRPGIIETDMTEKVKGKYDALIEGGLLLEKRWGTPADIGKATSMLARGELPYATGAVLVLDGGLTTARL